MKRENGFYWVNVGFNIENNSNSDWMIAYWSGSVWSIVGMHTRCYDKDFTEINETRLAPPTNET